MQCNRWRHHLPDMPILLGLWGNFLLLFAIHNQWNMPKAEIQELGIAGVPNQAAGHMAKMKIPEDQMDVIPFRVLESRLGRSLRKKKFLDITYKPAFECCRKGQLDVLHIHEDYIHLETLKGRCCLKRMCCCCCGDSSKMETDDYYAVLRDTGFVEVVEQTCIANAVGRWWLVLTLLCAILDILLKWAFAIRNPGVFDWSASALALETLDVTVGRATATRIALLAYWIGAKLRHGYIVGVRSRGTRGFINWCASSPSY